MLFVIIVLYVNPMAGFVDAWQEKRTEQANLVQLKRENADLEQRVKALSSSEGAEREARKMGMVAADERAYVIQSLRR